MLQRRIDLHPVQCGARRESVTDEGGREGKGEGGGARQMLPIV